MQTKYYISFLFIFMQFFPANPQEYKQLQDTIPLKEVVVTGTKTSENKEQIPNTISVLTREEMEATGESAILSMLSERIPGVFVTEKGVTGFGLATGSAGTINIRGVGGGNKVLMLFDGQPQWAGIFGHHLPDTYTTSDADKVEIIRGPASLLYGSNAMGGVINIITRKADKEGIHANGRLLFGSFNTQKYMSSIDIKTGKLDGFLSINHDQTDGHRENSGFKMTNGQVKIGYEFSRKWKISSNFLLAQINATNPGQENNPIKDNTVNALRGTYSISLDNHYQKMNGSVKAFYNFGHHELNNGYREGEEPKKYIFKLNDHLFGVSVSESFHLFKGNILTSGIDVKNWGGTAWNDSINEKKQYIVDKDVNEIGIYLLAQQSFSDKFFLNAGIRIEINEVYGNEWIPQLGLTYHAHRNTDLKVSVSKGFRSPNIKELYMYGQEANPNLLPESMMNYDCSIIQKLLNNKIQLELTAYYANGKNIIQLQAVNGRQTNTNSGYFSNKGIEFSVDYKISDHLNLNGNYSFLHTEYPLLGAPEHLAFLSANYLAIKKVSITTNLQYVGNLYTFISGNSAIASQTENYMLFNMKTGYKISQNLSLFLNGDNLINQKYTINYGFPMPGIVILGGIDLRF